MSMNQKDKRLLQDLAKQVAEVASLPIMAERREMWKRHNRLERPRPMILVFPEGSWRELLPQTVLKCEDENARRYDAWDIDLLWVTNDGPVPWGKGGTAGKWGRRKINLDEMEMMAVSRKSANLD